jgi:hypothetical protein
LLQLRVWLPQRQLVVVADRSFAVLELLYRMRQLANPMCMIVRLRLDAALYAPAPPREAGHKGRPRLKGARLPSLQAVLDDAQTLWCEITMRNWYGQGQRRIEVTSGTAIWYHTGKPPLPIRWVLIRDPKAEFRTQALCHPQTTPTKSCLVRKALASQVTFKYAPIWASRRSANGLTWPSPGLPPLCWACSR